jgi:hypothetical protein
MNVDPLPNLAPRLDRAAVQLHEMTHERQAETQPSFGARGRRIRLAKSLEDVRQHRRVDANTRVRDLDLCGRARGGDAQQ